MIHSIQEATTDKDSTANPINSAAEDQTQQIGDSKVSPKSPNQMVASIKAKTQSSMENRVAVTSAKASITGQTNVLTNQLNQLT